MDNYLIQDLNKIIKGEIYNSASQIIIKKISVDSRSVIDFDDTLFIAINGLNHDAHKYIEQLYNSGIKAFIVENNIQFNKYPNAVFIKVESSVKALQKITSYHRNRFDLDLIAVTGSNGKTTVKEWLSQLLNPYFEIVKSPKSYNSQIGVPLSVWQINNKHQIGIFEAGISQTNEMINLFNILNPKIGIFTNIGEAHHAGFKNLSEKVKEKLLLFSSVEKLIYCKDHSIIHDEIKKDSFLKSKTFTWSQSDKNADLYIDSIFKNTDFSLVKLAYKNTNYELKIPFIDKASIENCFHCISTLIYLKVDIYKIISGIENLSSIGMRLERMEGINDCLIINDSYNFDFNSLSIALDYISNIQKNRSKTLILSDMPFADDEKYLEIINLIESKGINYFIGIGKDLSRFKSAFSIDADFYNNTTHFIESFSFSQFRKEIILLKGARKFEFEKIANRLEYKSHTTSLDINLSAIRKNVNYFRELIPEGKKIMAMVKAYAYGTGGSEIAQILQQQRVDYLAVAYTDEGISLRNHGINLPIMVMNGGERSYQKMIESKLEPSAFNLNSLHEIILALKNASVFEYPIHLKLNTGMNRLGFDKESIPELLKIISENLSYIKIQSIYSHLATADDNSQIDFTKSQINLFRNFSSQINDKLKDKALLHILNTAGIIKFSDTACFDMVRLGIGMYGISPYPENQKYLQYVATLKTHISQIRTIEKGESVSYNRDFIAEKETKIGIVPIGYADGLSRSLGNENYYFTYNSQKVNIIGTVCMDMCMVDLSETEAQEGDEIIIFGESPTINDMAKACNTIPYEIISSISSRVRRLYYFE